LEHPPICLDGVDRKINAIGYMLTASTLERLFLFYNTNISSISSYKKRATIQIPKRLGK